MEIRHVLRVAGPIIGGMLALTLVSLISMYCAVQWFGTPEFSPLTYHNPAKILGVNGVVVTATIERCNSDSEDIAVTGSYTVRNVQTNGIIPQGDNRVSVWTPGCTTLTPDITLLNVPPGKYRLEGQAVARSTHNQTQVAAWFSEPFVIEGAP